MFHLGKCDGFLSYRHSKVNCFTKLEKSNCNAFKTMAANMKEHETSFGVINLEDENFSQSIIADNNTANDLSFSEDKEEEANI